MCEEKVVGLADATITGTGPGQCGTMSRCVPKPLKNSTGTDRDTHLRVCPVVPLSRWPTWLFILLAVIGFGKPDELGSIHLADAHQIPLGGRL